MNDKITEIKKAMSEATPGPWEYEFYEEMADVYPSKGIRNPICQMWVQEGVTMKNSLNNAEFIAKSPEYITYLLQLVETQSKALREIDELQTDYNANKDIRVKRIIKEALSII